MKSSKVEYTPTLKAKNKSLSAKLYEGTNLNCIVISPSKKTRTAIQGVLSKNKRLNVIGAESCIDDVARRLESSAEFIDVAFIEPTSREGRWEELDKFSNGTAYKVFTSASSELAQLAFEYSNAWYVPLPFTELAMMKAISHLSEEQHRHHKEPKENFIFVKNNGVLARLNFSDILYIQALADYVSIFTTTGRYVAHGTMKKMMQRLPEDEFKQVHKSYIVPLSKITRIDANAIVLGDKSIPLSKSFKKELLLLLDCI